MNKLQQWKEALSMRRFEDAGQKRAFGNILRFFALMLVLTLVAKGTAGATVPTVDAARPGRGVITEKVDLSGAVSAAGSRAVEGPEGVPVQSLLAKAGERVEAGQALVQYDPDEVQAVLQRAQAELKKLQIQQSQLRQPAAVDAGAVASAQQALDWAYEDLAKAQNHQTSLEADPNATAEALSAARDAVQSALRAAQSAESARNAALSSYNQSKQQADASAAAGSADAEVLAVDIAEKQDQIAALQALSAEGCQLKAPLGGTLLRWNLTEGAASTRQACSIADESAGYVASFPVPKNSASKVQAGAAVLVRQGSGQGVEATVTAVGAPDETGAVEASVRLPDGKWQEGAASATLTLTETEYPLCLPSSAVHKDNQGYFVYLLEEKDTVLGLQTIASRVMVNVEKEGEEKTAVSGTVDGQSKVVTGSSKPLSAGARVKVRQ